MKKLMLLPLVALVAAGCGGGHSKQDKQYNTVSKHAGNRAAYIPHNDVEFNNYNNAQKLYDSPTTIIWCSTTWANPNTPIVTVPIAGKLTSSSTTFFSPDHFIDRGNYSWQTTIARSVDGMYHPNPPQYRYGFTPGGQYVDLFNMPTLCTTALTKFQRQSTQVSVTVDKSALRAQRRAEQALAHGDHAKAQSILQGALHG